MVGVDHVAEQGEVLSVLAQNEADAARRIRTAISFRGRRYRFRSWTIAACFDSIAGHHLALRAEVLEMWVDTSLRSPLRRMNGVNALA